MKNKRNVLYSLIIMLTGVVIFDVKAQKKYDVLDSIQTQYADTSHAPQSITRNLMQDRMGTIWMASWQGVFKYNGRLFTNVTYKVSSARFFSPLEDEKGNIWFGELDGVHRYDARLPDGQGKTITDFNQK